MIWNFLQPLIGPVINKLVDRIPDPNKRAEAKEEFERELTASGQGKKGLVIDRRYNGGGWTTDYLMAVLNVRQHAYTIPRGATDDLGKNNTQFTQYYPYGERLPLAAWTKPAITLCNANSYSNA